MDNPIERARLRLARQDDEMFMPPGLPYFLSLEVVDYAEEQEKRATLAEQQLEDSEAARRQDAAHFRRHLAQIAALEARIRWQRRAFIAAGVVWPIVVIALWSLYAP
jgi:hypothetical protein